MYEDIADHMRKCIRLLLKQMYRKAHSVSEYMDMCESYEAFQFHKLEEVEYYYLMKKKYYLEKMFSKEFANKLESNVARPSFGFTKAVALS